MMGLYKGGSVSRDPLICKHCNKRILITFPYAMQVALRVKARTGIEMRVYACPRSHGFHLTSKDLWKEGE